MDQVKKAYDFYMEKYKKQWAEAKRTMEILNSMADDLNIQRPFESIVDDVVGGKPKLRDDQFVNKPLATAVYEYLSLVGKEIGARPWPEIVQALRDSGFEGLPKTKAAEEAARTNILKSTKIKLIGENSFGLVEWYGKKRERTKEEEEQPTEEEGVGKLEPRRGRPKKAAGEEGSLEPHPAPPKS